MRKRNIIIILVLVVVLVLIGAKCRKEEPAGEPEAGPKEEAENKTADWEIYKNEEYGFEVKYPPGGVAKRTKEKARAGDVDNFHVTLKSGQKHFFIHKYKLGELSDEEIINFENETKLSSCPEMSEPQKRETIFIDNVRVVKCIGIGIDHPNIASFVLNATFIKDRIIWVIKYMDVVGDYRAGLTVPEESENTFNQILSTFKFIEE